MANGMKSLGRECLDWVCAVKSRCFPGGASPTRRPLQPEATGAGMEATKCGQIDAYIAGLILLAAGLPRRWCLSGQTSWRANRISRCRKSRSTTRSWWWPSRRLWRRSRPVLDYRTMEHALAVARALYRRAGNRGVILADMLLAQGGQSALARIPAPWLLCRSRRCC
jgi:hypothetical protein